MPKPAPWDFDIIGHRGDGRGADENTLASCQRAVSKGADRLELDVQLVQGELRLVHPRRPAGDRLEDVLAEITLPLMLHIKRRQYNPWHDRRLLRALMPLIKGREVAIESFFPGTLTYIKRKFPGTPTVFATAWAAYDLRLSRRLRAKEYVSRSWIIGEGAMRLAAQRGIPLTVFTKQNTLSMAQKLQRLGVTSIMTDDITFWQQVRAVSGARRP